MQEANAKLRTKSQLFEGLQALGNYLPPLGSAMCTVKFMQDVRFGKCFCLQFGHLRIKPEIGRKLSSKELKA